MRNAILISPAPVDGYPPVQHQARLLADAGFRVELITTPLAWSSEGVRFSHAGVSVRQIRVPNPGALSFARRAAAFIAAVTSSRTRLQQDLVEIAYEPAGALYSDFAPRCPRLRIAHFHELLQRFDTSWIERRVAKSLRNYQLVVVPDADRAENPHEAD